MSALYLIAFPLYFIGKFYVVVVVKKPLITMLNFAAIEVESACESHRNKYF